MGDDTMTDTYEDAVVPDDARELDSVPEMSDIEYPCQTCGAEAGPYGGRGPKPKYCPIHKKGGARKTNVSRVGGNIATQAAQATAVLGQLNSMIALGLMALGLNGSAAQLANANPTFEEQAYNALITDPALCQLILKGGVKSAKISLAIAYGGLGMAVVPTAVMELREKKAERELKRMEEETISHGGINAAGA